MSRTVRARPQDADRYVGTRMRERRVMLGLTQTQMAELIGVTYQQAHKYEKGINRIAAGRLYDIAQALGVEVTYFFEDFGDEPARQLKPHQRQFLELAKNFMALKDEGHRQAITQLARTLAADGSK